MIVLKGGRLIDGTGAAPVNGATIVIKDNRIDAVTTRTESDFPAGARDHRRIGHDDPARADRLPRPHGQSPLRHGASLAPRRAAEHTASAHRRGAEADPRRRLYRGARRRRARYRVQAGDRGRADRRSAADAVAVDHFADRRHRRRGQPVRPGARRLLLHPRRPAGAAERRDQPRRCARCRAQDGAGRRRRDQMRDDRRRQLAPRPRAARRRLHPRRDAHPGRRGAGARPPRDVPRARRARSRHRDRGRRQFDRARLLSGREPAPSRTHGRARHLFHADAARLRVPPPIAAAACPRARRGIAGARMSRR